MSILNPYLVSMFKYKEIAIYKAKKLSRKYKPIIKNCALNIYNNNVIDGIIIPNVEYIENKVKYTKWTIESCEILCGAMVFGTIYDKLKWRILGFQYCLWLGSVSKCNYGIHMSFIGVLVAMYSLTMSISLEFLELPSSMIFKEIDLCAFRLGLWTITSANLFYWFKSKMELQYALGKYRPKDRLNKMELFCQIIGDDVNKVRRMWRRTIKLICLNFLLRIFEIYIKNIKKDMIKKEMEARKKIIQ